jgi:membrane protease YdiL (CAAX protease family)
MNSNKRWLWGVIWCILIGILGTLFPFFVPGSSAGFAAPANPVTYVLLVAYYCVIPLVIILSPLGRKKLPEWIRGTDRKYKYIGLAITFVAGLLTWFLPWSLPYWYVYQYEPSMGVATLIGYMWWVPLFSLAITVITVPLVEALRRSGLPKVPGAIW